jgi:O-antigen/teichoic acid export membrane protein
VDVTAAVLALAIVYWIAGPLAAGHSNQTALRQMIEIYALALPFLLLRSTFMGLLTALKSFRAVAGLQVALPAAELAAISWLARQGEAAAVTGLAIGAITASLITMALGGWLFWRSTGSWRGAGYLDAWRELRPFMIYGSLQGSLKSLTANLDLVVLGFLRPASEVGYYALARSGVGVLATMVAPLAQVLHPLLNEAWVGRRWGALRRLIASFMLINGLAGLAALAALLLMGRWLVTNIYGPAYTPAVVLMQVLVIAVALQAVFGWMRRLLLVAGLPRLDLVAGVCGTVFFLILVVPASVFGGAIGLAGLEILRATLMVAIFAWAISTKVGTRSLDLESS